MATYVNFNGALPNGASQNGTQFGQSTRDNLNAIRDAVVMGGGFFGWTMALSGGTTQEPASIIYTKGTENVRVDLVWSSGNVSTATYYYYVTGNLYTDGRIGIKTIYYTGGDVSSTSWGP